MFTYGLVGVALIAGFDLVCWRLASQTQRAGRESAWLRAVGDYALHLLMVSAVYSMVYVPGEMATMAAIAVTATAPARKDAMTIDTLLSRASNGALADPAPAGEALEQIMQAGLCAPDHGKLHPGRFVLIQGDARAAFADLAVNALLVRDPSAPDSEQQRMRGKLLAPPLIVVLGAHLTPGHKVPETEQVQSIAASAMNMLNAAHALGFAGKWVTGPNAYDPAIAHALGLEQVVGFLYLGTPAEPAMTPRRPASRDYFRSWSPA